MGIRERIIEFAGQRGLDYKKLADLSGLPRPTVHRYLHSKNDLTGERIDKLLVVLGLAVGRHRRTKAEIDPPKALFMEPVAGTKALLRYPGSKWRMMLDLVRQLPPHEHYVVLFGGSGADLLRKPPSALETFNDLDDNVSSLFTVLQDDQLRERLSDKVAVTPAQSQRAYEDALAIMDKDADPVKRAWAFLVVSHQGYCLASPSFQQANRWRFGGKPNSNSKNWSKLPEIIEATAQRFKHVQLPNRSWQDVLQTADSPTTLFMADPPYFPGTFQRQYYRRTLTVEDHKELLAAFNDVKGFVILSGYSNELYDVELAHWRRVEFSTSTTMALNGGRAERAEISWMNFDEHGKRIIH
jgi:DNA adenine methylase